MATDDDPVKVKQLLEWAARKSVGAPVDPDSDAPVIDEETRAQLEQWFGLPSFQQVEDAKAKAAEAAKPADGELAQIQERRAAAIAAVDPKLVEHHRVRVEKIMKMCIFTPNIDIGNGLRIKPDGTFLDQTMIARVGSIAEPREVEIPGQLEDDLKACTPQALLRDLHRPVMDFDKTFEITDMMMENRVDLVAIVEGVMTGDYAMPPPREPTFTEGSRLVAEAAKLRRVPVSDIPNRRAS